MERFSRVILQTRTPGLLWVGGSVVYTEAMSKKEYLCPNCFHAEHRGPCLSAEERAAIERKVQADAATARMIAEREDDK